MSFRAFRPAAALAPLAALFFILVLSSPRPLAAAESGFQCPRDADALRAMIDDLKDTFECSGLNFSDCNRYRSGSIGGALGASMAAGLAVLKKRPEMMGCLLSASGPSGRIDWPRLLRLIDEAQAQGQGCQIAKDYLARDLRQLANDHEREARELGDKMAERMAKERAPSVDLKRISVNEEQVRDRMLKGLEDLRQKLNSPEGKTLVRGEEARRELLESLEHRMGVLRTATNGTITAEMVDTHERVWHSLTEEGRASLPERTTRAVNYWEARADLKLERVEMTRGEAVARQLRDARAELNQLSQLASRAEQEEYLKSRGYKPAAIKDLLDANSARQSIAVQHANLRFAHQDLMNGSLAKTSQLRPEDVRKLVQKNLPHLAAHPSIHFVPTPALNESLAAKVVRAGRSELAKLGAQGTSKLAAAGKVAGLTVATAGKAIASPLVSGAELALYSSDSQCQGERKSPYSTRAFVDGRCRTLAVRTPMTDAFLFGLSEKEQLEHLRQSPDACEMLVGLHENYAPGRQWKTTCETDGRVTLSGHSPNAKGQVLRFSPASSGPPREVEWISSETGRCAKVTLREGRLDRAMIYRFNPEQPVCGPGGGRPEVVTAATIRRHSASTDSTLKTGRDLDAWLKTNNFALTSASACCQGESNSLCPSGLRPEAAARPEQSPARSGGKVNKGVK